MCNNRDHLGIRFEIWSGEWTWFWRAFDAGRDRGAVGATASEADAVREACAAIEEMNAACSRVATPRFSMRATRETWPGSWNGCLDRFAEYLASI